MPYTQLNNLDFANIKSALKDYMRAQSDFTDYDFEGSALSNLLDVLAYNTYYTAFNTNMVVNEMYLDSATLRDNVVSLAKNLGYTPKSVTAPRAVVDLVLTFTGTPPATVTLKAGTGFITNYDGSLFRYIVREDTKVEVANSVATFSNLSIIEGNEVVTSTVIDTTISDQRFFIDNVGADTNTIKVKVFQSANTSVADDYSAANNILDIGAEDKVFFVNEREDERYEVFFGDGVLGKKLENGNVVEMSYVVTNGEATNGARTFTFNGVMQDENGSNISVPYNVTSISTVSNASGGAPIETIDKIKFNAPKYYGSQNRAVTGNDYKAIVRNLYPAVSDIIVFGGEDQEPPAYGKVFLSVKPTEAAALSAFTKNELTSELKKYTVASIRPEFVDPSILFVELDSKIYYSGTKTTQLPTEMASSVATSVTEYLKTSQTEKFNGKFRYSKFVGVIDNTDRAINSNDTNVTMRKDFIAQINSSAYYEICYKNPFLIDCNNPVVTSTGMVVFEYPSFTSYLEDRDGKLVLYRLDSVTGEKILLNDSVGTVDYTKGEIKMDNFTILKGTFSDNRIELRAKPANKDIEVKREMYLDVDISKSKFVAYKEE
tara:strand:- start:20348 stop:22153 length:1806 start_codon:yes stop_codon:yes gene_type:complete